MQPFCECIWFKSSCKSIITMKEALLRFTVITKCYGHFYTSIKISIFKTLRRLDTTWNFARSITRVSTHEHEHWEHCLCTQFTKKKVFEQLMLAVACSASRRPANQEVSIVSECDVTWRTVKVDRYCLSATTIHAISNVIFRLFILLLFLIWSSFFNFRVNIVFR